MVFLATHHPQACSSRLSTLDGVRGRWASLAASAQLGEPDLTHTLSFPPHRRNRGSEWLSWPELCCWVVVMRLNCSWCPSSGHQTQILLFLWYLELLCWTPGCPLGSFMHGSLSKTVFSKGPRTMAKRGWSWVTGHFRVHSWDQGLGAYDLRLPWVPLQTALDPQQPQGTLVHDAC